MQRGIRGYLVAPLIVLGLVGCRFVDFEEREPWRTQAEEQCVAQRLVQPSNFMESAPPVNGRGKCGMDKPFHVAAVNGGFVEFKPKATLSCPLIASVETWFHESIQPAAMAWYGSPVVEIKQISAYSCRTMNGQAGAAISEHAFGNALDIASFRFADGREVEFKTGWKGRPEERGFLRAVHAAACERFSTVLAPGADMFHYDHIHVDLARRASGRGICKPEPMSQPAPAPRLEVPVARGPSPYPQTRHAEVSAAPSTSPWAQRSAQQPVAQNPPPHPTASPWAHSAPQVMQRPAGAPQGPTVIERSEPMRAAVGQPLVLGNQAPPPNSFGAPVPIAERVRQSLGMPQPAPVYAPPAAMPPQQNPHGLVPPGRIPNAHLNADPTVTGSIPARDTKGKAAEKKPARAAAPEASLMSPRSIAEEAPSSEPASVFNLPAASRSGN